MLAAIMRRATLDGLDPQRLGLETAFLLRACGCHRPRRTGWRSRRYRRAAPELRRLVLDLCAS